MDTAMPAMQVAEVDALLEMITVGQEYRLRSAQRAGLRVSESQAIAMIDRAGSMAQVEVADGLGITSGAVTGLIDRLQRSGLVERLRDLDDRRRNQVRLTAAGQLLVADDRARLEGALAVLPADQQADFLRQLVAVAERLADHI